MPLVWRDVLTSFNSQASIHTSLPRDSSLSHHVCNILCAWSEESDQTAIHTLLLGTRWDQAQQAQLWPSIEQHDPVEGAAFSTSWVSGSQVSHPNLPTRVMFMSAHRGLVPHQALVPTISPSDPNARHQQLPWEGCRISSGVRNLLSEQ